MHRSEIHWSVGLFLLASLLVSLLPSTIWAAQPQTPASAVPWAGIPTVTQAKGGHQGDPVNIGFEGSQSAILAAFRAIGWQKADPLSIKHDLELVQAALHHGSYKTAPVSNLYLLKRPEDFSVEHELGWVAHRDHARFWNTGRVDPVTHLPLYVGDAARDIGIKLLFKHHFPIGTTHRIDGNVDAERDLIVNALMAAGLVRQVIIEPGITPAHTGVNGGGDRYTTDGLVKIVILKAV